MAKNLKDPSDVVCLVYDNGLFVEQARVLAKTFKKVYYYVPWESAFPKMNVGLIGYGYPELELVSSPFGKHFDEIDLFHFPDLNSGPFQQYLVDIGKTVWGCRLGECLELQRRGMKEILKKLDLPVGKYWKIVGMTNLRAFLKENENVFVKIDKWRGTFETFRAKNYKEVEPKLDEVEFKLGAFKHIIEFTVEAELADMVEVGTDGWTVDGQYPKNVISGLEIKDKGFLSIFNKYEDIPEPIRRFNDRMKPVFEAYGYRGFFSTEVRLNKELSGWMLDFCSRSPSPPSELYATQYKNLAECVWYGANGIIVEPEAEAKYGAEIMLHSSFADSGWQPVEIEEDARNFVKLRNATKIDGREYVIPQTTGLSEIGAVCGLGDTMKGAIDHALANAQKVHGYYIEAPTSAIDEALEQIEKMEEFGINYFKE